MSLKREDARPSPNNLREVVLLFRNREFPSCPHPTIWRTEVLNLRAVTQEAWA